MPSGSDFKYATGDTTAWKNKYYAFVDYALSVGASVADIEAFLLANSSFSPVNPSALDSARDCLTAGTGSAYTVTFTPAFTALVNGIALKVRWHTDSLSSPTLDLDGLGAKAIVQPDGTIPAAGSLKATYTGQVVYNATLDQWVLVSSVPAPTPAYLASARGLTVAAASVSTITISVDEILLDDGQSLPNVSLTVDMASAGAKNGRGTGVPESSDTWYYAFVSHDGGVAYGWLDTDPDGANDPDASDTGRLYVGAVYNDSGSDIVSFTQIGGWNIPDEPSLMLSGGTATSYTLTGAAQAPPHVRLLQLRVEIAGGVTVSGKLSIDGSNLLYHVQDTASGDSNKQEKGHAVLMPCTDAQKVYYLKESTSTSMAIDCLGYFDHKVRA